MDDPRVLRKQAVEKMKAAKAIYETAKAAGLEVTDEEVAQAEALDQEATALEARAEKIIKAERKSAALDGRISSHDIDPVAVARPRGTGIEVGIPKFVDDPKFGFKDNEDFLLSVMVARGREPRDERLKTMAGMIGDMKATAGSDEHGAYSDPYGGYMIPEGIIPGLKMLDPEGDLVASRVTSIPMTTPIVKIAARVDKDHSTSVTGGLLVYRRAETDTVSATRMATEEVKLEAIGLHGLAYATNELLERSPTSFASLLSQGFNSQFATKIAGERIDGTGVGQFEGILNTPSVISVAIETAQTILNPLVYENALKMLARCWWSGNGTDPRVWMMNRNLIPYLGTMKLDVGTGGSSMFVFSAVPGMPMTLFGLPIVFSEKCKTAGTVGDIILANWSEYLEGTYKPMRSLSSIHVRFVENETCFKFWLENDGRCWWRSALTPENGATLSPFVTLAVRA